METTGYLVIIIFLKKKFTHFKLPTGIVLNDLLKDYKVCLPTIMIRRSLLKNEIQI